MPRYRSGYDVCPMYSFLRFEDGRSWFMNKLEWFPNAPTKILEFRRLSMHLEKIASTKYLHVLSSCFKGAKSLIREVYLYVLVVLGIK